MGGGLGLSAHGSKTLIILYNHYADTDPVKAGQYPFFIASTLCIFSAALALCRLQPQAHTQPSNAAGRCWLRWLRAC